MANPNFPLCFLAFFSAHTSSPHVLGWQCHTNRKVQKKKLPFSDIETSVYAGTMAILY